MAKRARASRKKTAVRRLTKRQLRELEDVLRQRRQQLLAQQTDIMLNSKERELEAGRDEYDESSDENMFTNELRLRGREKTLLKKIDKALERIAAGEYDICEECGGVIGYERLKARPVATLCISCKEEQELQEKMRYEEEATPALFHYKDE